MRKKDFRSSLIREVPADHVVTCHPQLTHQDLIDNQSNTIFFDSECYSNYFTVVFSLADGRSISFERKENLPLDTGTISWILYHYEFVGFNSNNYDLPLLMCALRGDTCQELKAISDSIINNENRFINFEEFLGIKIPRFNHIDLINIAPGKHSLKLYGARLNFPKLQDLPFEPERVLTSLEMNYVKDYCHNDVKVTIALHKALKPVLNLRVALGDQYGLELRSRGDAAIAEAVISSELKNVNGWYPKKPNSQEGDSFLYVVPQFIKFGDETLNQILSYASTEPFIITKGKVKASNHLEKYQFYLGELLYTFAKGGIHSCEKKRTLRAGNGYHLIDADVASYYPATILNQKLFPPTCGENFLKIYENIVNARLEAKGRGDKITADMLKIVINGTFGKFGQEYSKLNNYRGLIQVTLTGQLSILMLIEWLRYYDIETVSANTDGIVCRVHESKLDIYNETIKLWEYTTGFKTEFTNYSLICSRDINNYFAVKTDGKVKYKGIFNDPNAINTDINSKLSNNASNQVIYDAVINLITKDIPLTTTIYNEQDITKFLKIQTVMGGAQVNNHYIGKVVRFYHAKNYNGAINYAISGNLVPDSTGAKPLMDLAPVNDIDFEWYIKEAEDLLFDVGFRVRHDRLF